MIRTLQLVKPQRLEVMFGGEHARVEENHDDDEPVERLRLYHTSARFAAVTIRQVQRPPEPSTVIVPTHANHSSIQYNTIQKTNL